MTNDELTPEEREALANLPRERMPSAGLEDRVVAAMRQQGHLTRKPARVIRLTTSRVAGLLAACLVLMIGAYSIGLHRGVNNEVLTKVEPRPNVITTDNLAREEAGGVRPPSTLGTVESQPVVPQSETEAQFVDKDAPPFEPKLNVPQLAKSKDAKKPAERTKKDEVAESMAKEFSEQIAAGSAAPATPAPELKLQASRQAVEPQAMMDRSDSVEAWRTFALAGGNLMVEAPDSLRIVTDEQGRTLLIYTSDGIIRIRLAD